VNHTGVPVDVAPLERDPLLGPEAGQRGDDRKRGEPRAEFDRDRLHVDEGFEGGNLPPLRLRIRDEPRDVPLDQPGPHRVGEHLPERLVDVPGGRFGRRFRRAPSSATFRRSTRTALNPPVPQPCGERAAGVRLRVVLAQVLGDELGEGRHRLAPDGGDVATPERLDLV
jgi:hypothetical protein